MQLSKQRGEAGAVVFALASVAFILKVDSSVQRAHRGLRICQLIHLQRLQRRQRSSQLRLHHVAAPLVHELRQLLGQRASVVEDVHLPRLEVHPQSSTFT
jgi:hypothetical protein